ncbi:hypothetical protein TNCV_1074391 [Trichonephila clavipes]|uniref:Uncharacterized protein n=1 Tax=Trichonephila clavipes TaxID=2585209 RepID=A0A8X6VLK7_TRICX|nr:hypothetical protein TNCV_1074391 [Trichonephila clavipes]
MDFAAENYDKVLIMMGVFLSFRRPRTPGELGKIRKETYAILVRIHEDQALFFLEVCVRVIHPYSRIPESVSDETRSGRPVTSVSNENIEKTGYIVHQSTSQSNNAATEPHNFEQHPHEMDGF